MEPLPVLVVSADPLSRAGLAALLAGRADLSVAGQAAPDGELHSAIEAASPRAAAWDLGGDGSGLDRLREAAEAGLPVLVLLSPAEGLSNKAIAGRLGISDHTAKFHVNAILGKLGAGSRSEAIVRAARLGLVVL